MQIQNPQRSGLRLQPQDLNRIERGSVQPMEGYTSFGSSLPRPKNVQSQDDVLRHYEDLIRQLEENIRLRKSRGLYTGADEKLLSEAFRYIDRADSAIRSEGDFRGKQRVEDRLNPRESRLGSLERPTYEGREEAFQIGAKGNQGFWSPKQIALDIRKLERELGRSYSKEKERRLLERQLDLEVVNDQREWEQEAQARTAAGPKAQQHGLPEAYARQAKIEAANAQANAQANAVSKARGEYADYRWGDRGLAGMHEKEALRSLGIQDPRAVRRNPQLFAQYQSRPEYQAELARLEAERRGEFDKKVGGTFDWALTQGINPYGVRTGWRGKA